MYLNIKKVHLKWKVKLFKCLGDIQTNSISILTCDKNDVLNGFLDLFVISKVNVKKLKHKKQTWTKHKKSET